MAEQQLTDAQAIALGGTTDSATGVAYLALAAADHYTAITQLLYQLNSQAFAVCQVFEETVALKVGTRAGRITPASGIGIDVAASAANAVTDDADTYFWITAAGVITSGAALPTTSLHVALAKVTAADGAITAILDLRFGATLVPGGYPEYRSQAATPVGSLTPTHIGEEVLETTTTTWYKSTGLTSADWVALN